MTSQVHEIGYIVRNNINSDTEQAVRNNVYLTVRGTVANRVFMSERLSVDKNVWEAVHSSVRPYVNCVRFKLKLYELGKQTKN